MSTAVFFEPILVSTYVLKYVYKNDPTRLLYDQDRSKIENSLRGIKIETSHQSYVRQYTILGVTIEPVSNVMFTLDNEKMSVAQFFQNRYNIDLEYPNLPAIEARDGAKPIFLPMEVCKIVAGQRYSNKLDPSQGKALLNASFQHPSEREKIITNIRRSNDYDNVRSELTSIEARVLPPPMLKYGETGREKCIEPSSGRWNMHGKKMVNGGNVDCWACLNFSMLHFSCVDTFCRKLIELCYTMGMTFESIPLFPTNKNQLGIREGLLYSQGESEKAEKKLQLLIIILPDETDSYGTIKKVCETELGIVSQCCMSSKVERWQTIPSYMEHIALKMNLKVGGRNTVLEKDSLRNMLDKDESPIIVFGADVSHPRGSSGSSIAAVVASMDWPGVTKYKALVSAQGPNTGVIQDLYTKKDDPQKGVIHGGMIREHLLSFRKSTGKTPGSIIFYRDGVSDSQFNQVLLYEVEAIRQACMSLFEDNMPKITFVLVRKKHHMSLFPSTNTSGNITPCTIVDTKIRHPTEFGFYLYSHAGVQGTRRPTHYRVVYDENNFSADALQILTYNLCYTYARSTTSVSIVPPTYYAHLAASRARHYVEDLDSSAASGGGGGLPDIKENVKDVMFYC